MNEAEKRKYKSLLKCYDIIVEDHAQLQKEYERLKENFTFLSQLRTEELRAFIIRYYKES